MFLTLTIWGVLVASTNGDELTIFENDSNKMQHRVEEKNLFTFEKTLRKQIVRTDPSDEVFAFATSGSFDFILDLSDKPVAPKELMVITVRGKTAELQWSSDRGKTRFRRKLAEDEIDSIRKFVTHERVDQLPVLIPLLT